MANEKRYFMLYTMLFKKNILLLVAALLLISGHIQAQPAAGAQNKRPNILVILSDDMGYSDIGCFGSEINTPNLDKMAANGLRFSQFYNNARCCPSRAALLTGLYPHQSGMGWMNHDQKLPGYRGDLNKKCVTIAEVLKTAGYNTYMSGKWHVAKYEQGADSMKYNWPMQRGFEKFYGTITGAGSYWDPGNLTRGNTFITPLNDPEYKPQQYYYTDAISDNAIKDIRQHHAKKVQSPFFMYVAYTAAHWPLQAPEEEIAPYKGKYDKGFDHIRKERFKKLKRLGLANNNWNLTQTAGNWDTVKNKAWYARNMEVYAAMITRMDKGIGNIIQTLKQTGELENTLIFFLQDNGACAEHTTFLKRKNTPDTLSAVPLYKTMGVNDLQIGMAPLQTRAGFPVIVQSEKVMSGSAQTYNGYGINWANVSNTPFREYKHWVHEGGISTPLIVYWPAAIKDKGKIRQQPAHLVDIMATCVAAAKASYPANYKGEHITPMEGKNLIPVFLSNTKINREAIYWEHEGNRAIRKGKWKLVSKAYPEIYALFKKDSIRTDQWELFDMAKDRTETINLAAKNPAVVKELSAMWYKWAYRTHTLPNPL